MKISQMFNKAISFFRKSKTRYGCIAVIERMLLSKIDEDKLASLNNMSVPNKHTRQVPVFDTAIPYIEEQYLEEQRIREERERREHRNRPPRRK